MDKMYKSVTDERLVIDVVAPGFGEDAITVKTAKVNGGEAFKITVEGKYVGRKNKSGDPIPRVASEKYVEDFKEVLSDDANYGNELFHSSTFTTKDYDLDNMCYDVRNGIVRISIPKTALAKGTVAAACKNADADSTGTPKSDAVAD